MQGLLTGSAGAGAITSNSGNTAIDVANSTTSAIAQSRPKVDDPDVVAAEAAQKPIRDQNLMNNINNIIQQQTINNLTPSITGSASSNNSSSSDSKKSIKSIVKLPEVTPVTPKKVIPPLGDSPLQSVVKKPEVIQGQNLGIGQ